MRSGTVLSTTKSHTPTEPLCVAIITHIMHYTIGGLPVDASVRVMSSSSIIHPRPHAYARAIPALWAAGELILGAHRHGRNRLACAASSLLAAVVFGRVAGDGGIVSGSGMEARRKG
ncbi:hypothetical protein C8R45DRAFT_555531 [Mycena sanguinolenta]|nr:hypothetical protein C8R45DRAFT_555531 [Mycena sanguinolenta]